MNDIETIMDQSDKFDSRISAKMKHLRQVSGLRLSDVAKLANCSQGTISKIERGQTSPSVNILHRLAKAYGVNMSELFEDTSGEAGITIKKSERPKISPWSNKPGGKPPLESLLPLTYEGELQAFLHTIQVGESSDGLIQHEGEEFGYVLEGVFELTVGNRKVVLEEGDTFFFQSEHPHGYHNPGETPVKVIWINTPPTY